MANNIFFDYSHQELLKTHSLACKALFYITNFLIFRKLGSLPFVQEKLSSAEKKFLVIHVANSQKINYSPPDTNLLFHRVFFSFHRMMHSPEWWNAIILLFSIVLAQNPHQLVALLRQRQLKPSKNWVNYLLKTGHFYMSKKNWRFYVKKKQIHEMNRQISLYI